MLIQVTSVGEVVTKQGKKVPYKMFELNYLSNGRAGKKQIMSFTDVFKTLLASAEGEEFEITTQQDGEYTNWATATSKGVTTAPNSAHQSPADRMPAKGATAFKSTYETPEERAKKQVYIIKSVALKEAVSFHTGQEDLEFTVQDVLNIAKQFEEYVFGNTEIVSDDLNQVEVD
jgi:hypothetical protein